jgi:hypothetical protein
MQTVREMLWFDWQRGEHVAFAVFAVVVVIFACALVVRSRSPNR